MNGVTGRMGLNQHLRRSVAAIIAQGGLRAGVEAPPLPAGAHPQCTEKPEHEHSNRPHRRHHHERRHRTHGAEPAPAALASTPSSQQGGVQAERRARSSCRSRCWWAATRRSSRRSRRNAAACPGPPTSTRRSPIREYSIYFDAQTTDRRADVRARRRSPRASTSTARSRSPTASTPRSSCTAAREAAGVKHGVVQDKLWLPGMLKLKTLRDLGFFGRHPLRARRVRLLGVRRRHGARPAALLELPQGGRRRHHHRHAVPLALRARQPVRHGEGRLLPGRDAHPASAGTKPASRTTARPTIPPTPPSSSRAASSRTSTRRGACACAATTC